MCNFGSLEVPVLTFFTSDFLHRLNKRITFCLKTTYSSFGHKKAKTAPGRRGFDKLRRIDECRWRNG